MERMREYDFYLHPGKCTFFLDTVVYLGMKIDSSGISIPDSGKQAVRDWPVPEPDAMPLKKRKKNLDGKTALRTFLGFVGWYRKFIFRFSERAAPISELLKDDQQFHWGEAQQKAFEDLKEAVISAPVLQIFDSSLDAVVRADFSKVGI